MQCEACKAEVHPVQEMLPNGAGFTNRCPRLECGAPMARIEPRNVVGDEVQGPLMAFVAPGFPETIKVTVPEPDRSASTTAQSDMVATIRERLMFVESQLANVDKLQAEARRLRAMIAAVEALDAN